MGFGNDLSADELKIETKIVFSFPMQARQGLTGRKRDGIASAGASGPSAFGTVSLSSDI